MEEHKVVIIRMIIDSSNDVYAIPDTIIADCIKDTLDNYHIDVYETYKGVIHVRSVDVT